MSRWLVGSSRISSCGACGADQREGEPRLLAARQLAGRQVSPCPGSRPKPPRRVRRRSSRSAGSAPRQVLERAVLAAAAPRSGAGRNSRPAASGARITSPAQRRQPPGEQLGEASTCRCRWRRAARCGRPGRCADRADPAPRGRRSRRRRRSSVISGGAGTSGSGKRSVTCGASITAAIGSSLASALSAALRLARLGRLVAEAVDERLHVLRSRVDAWRAPWPAAPAARARTRSKAS